MSNDNYSTVLDGAYGTWGAPAYYASADAGEFNQLNANGCFAAFVTFMMHGPFFDGLVSPASAAHIWGNLDVANNRGWRIGLGTNIGGQLVLATAIGDGAATLVAEAPMTAIGGGPTGPIGRLIHAAIFFDGNANNLFLYCNGTRVATVASAYGASALVATLGSDIPGNDSADNVDILSCGYTYNLDLAANADTLFADYAFRAAREVYGASAPIWPARGVDWVHRYSASGDVAGSAGTITKFPSNANFPFPGVGANPFGLPLAPSVLTDLGNQLVPSTNIGVPAVVAPSTPLTYLNGQQLPPVSTYKNCDWYAGMTFPYPGA